MKKIFLIATTILISQLTVAQISNINMNGVPARLSSYSGVDGSPYLFSDWSKADIETSNAGLKEDVAYRLNIHDNELEVINEAGNKIYLNKDFVEYAVLHIPSVLVATSEAGILPSLVFKKGYDVVKGVEPDELVNVIAEGEKYTLIRKFYSDLVTPPKNSYSPSPGQMFVFTESFYLIDSNNNVTSVRNKTSNILKALNQKDQSLAKDIVKDNKLNLSREDHLTIFFQKLNES